MVITYRGLYILRGSDGFDIINRKGEDVANDLKTELDAYIFIHEMKA